MPKDDYHVIAYKILACLYVQLKAGADIDPQCLATRAVCSKSTGATGRTSWRTS